MAKETIETLTVRGNRVKARLDRIDVCIERATDKGLIAQYEKEKTRRLAEMNYLATKFEALQES